MLLPLPCEQLSITSRFLLKFVVFSESSPPTAKTASRAQPRCLRPSKAPAPLNVESDESDWFQSGNEAVITVMKKMPLPKARGTSAKTSKTSAKDLLPVEGKVRPDSLFLCFSLPISFCNSATAVATSS